MGIDLMLRGRSRPGWIRRGQVELSALAAWLRQECAAELESLDEDRTSEGEPRLLVWLHPAAESVEIVALPEGEVEILARTTPTGPGYHFYLTRLLKKLGEEQRIDWLPPVEAEDADASYDDTGFFFGEAAGEVYLQMDHWLATVAQLILERAAEGDSGFALGMPLQTGYAQLDFANTPLGPRSREWVERVAEESWEAGAPRAAAEFFPWPREGQDGDYWFRRAMVLLWTQAVWRPSVTAPEQARARRIDEAFARAWRLDAGSAAAGGWPWREWMELRELTGIRDDLDEVIAEQAKLVPAERPRWGYRRHEVVHRLMGGWSVRLPGSFGVEVDGEAWRAQDGLRVVVVALFEREAGSVAGGAESGWLPSPGEGVEWTYVEETPMRSGRAFVAEPATGLGVYHLHGLVAVAGQFATVTVAFEGEGERDWALGVWRSVRCLPARGG